MPDGIRPRKGFFRVLSRQDQESTIAWTVCNEGLEEPDAEVVYLEFFFGAAFLRLQVESGAVFKHIIISHQDDDAFFRGDALTLNLVTGLFPTHRRSDTGNWIPLEQPKRKESVGWRA